MVRVNRRPRDLAAAVAAAAIALALGGCEGGLQGGGQPDVGPRVDSSPRDDAGGPGEIDAGPDDDRGLVLKFQHVNPIPGALGGPWDAEVTTVALRLTELVVVGDTAIGDDRTRLATVPLAWGGIEQDVDEARLPLAPAGRYSRVEARIAAVVLEGTLDEGDVTGPFRIEVETAAGWPFGFSMATIAVEPGASTILPIEVDVRELIDAVPWSAVEPDASDVFVVENGDVWVSAIRDQADDVFDDP